LRGGIATVISPIFIEAPWIVGTGASQATFAFAGCAAVFAWFRSLRRVQAWSLIALVVIPGVVLDVVYAGYFKPELIAGFSFGVLFGLFCRKSSRVRGQTSRAS